MQSYTFDKNINIFKQNRFYTSTYCIMVLQIENQLFVKSDNFCPKRPLYVKHRASRREGSTRILDPFEIPRLAERERFQEQVRFLRAEKYILSK